jgi:hypothetical protein
MRERSIVAAVAAAAVLSPALAAPAGAAAPPTRFEWLKGYDAPQTPAAYDKVGVLQTGPRRAKNVLVMIPGTSASAAYFAPLARHVVEESPGWQVWSVERRENLLEDHSAADAAKAGRTTPQALFDFYLGSISNPAVSPKYAGPTDAQVGFAREWGMRVAVEDLRRVVREARERGGRVVLGGHSLGGTITTAYATWDFGGRAGARDLAGLVYMDGASRTEPVTPDAARRSLFELGAGTPWLSIGGIPAPLAGLFNIVGSGLAKLAPQEPSILQTWPLLPSFLNAPVRVTNEAGYGFALDSETSPSSLALVQVHAGRLADAGDPRPWEGDGELTPVQRVADAFFGTGLRGRDGTAWFHPRRLTIDAGAVGNGNANPAQDVLDVRATHGTDLGRLRIYAFAASLGGRRVLQAARALAAQSRIPADRVSLVNRSDGYTHIDPVTAHPDNDFVTNLTRFLRRIANR